MPMTVPERWHEVVATKNWDLLDELLADDCVFHSPVVHTPQQGKAISKVYLMSALQVLDGMEYVREIVGERQAMLEFTKDLDGIAVNGIDLFRWNDKGQIVDFKVMIRPLKAINHIHQMMGAKIQEHA
jgi:hypothetical protein